MTFKEWTAAIMVVSAVAVSGWVGWGLLTEGPPPDAAAGAWQMLWAIFAVIVFNIVAAILVAIGVSIVQREEFKDEAGDERDRTVHTRAMGNGYMALSIGILGVLGLVAFGLDPVLVPHALFGISMLAGGVFAVSQLVYYRIG